MLVERPVFVTPHAMRQFRHRVAKWSDREIIVWLNRELQRLPDEVELKTGALLYKIPFGPSSITAIVTQGERNAWPAVVTILGNSQQVDRYLSWRGRSWTQKDSRRLKILKSWGFSIVECARIMDKPVRAIAKRWNNSGSGVLSNLRKAE